MKTQTRPTNPGPTHEEIIVLAQQLYEREGCPFGRAEIYWVEAECQLRQRRDSNGLELTAGGAAVAE